MRRARQAAAIVVTMAAVAMAVRVGAQSGAAGLRQTAYIKASNPHMGDHFGNGGTLLGDSVALSGDGLTLAVGAPNESGGGKGVNGNQDDTSVYSAGAVYVYTRRNTNSPWTQQAYVKASNPQAGAEFGHVVSLSADGNTMAVSAYFEASAARGIDGNQNDDSIPQAGAAYVFTRRGTAWSQQAYIKASNTGEAGTDGNFGDGDQFGFSLSLSDDGNTLAVGANAEDSNATGINGNQQDNSMQSAGAAYLFVRSGTTWTQQAYVKAPNTAANVQFGYSVALSADGNTFAVSSFDEGGSTRGVVNGPNGAENFEDLGIPDGARDCPAPGLGPMGSARSAPAQAADGANRFAPFDRADSRFLDDVRAWPSVEPAIDFTGTAALAFALQ